MSIEEFATEETQKLFSDFPAAEREALARARAEWPAQGVRRVIVDTVHGAISSLGAGEVAAMWAERDIVINGQMEVVVGLLIDGPDAFDKNVQRQLDGQECQCLNCAKARERIKGTN